MRTKRRDQTFGVRPRGDVIRPSYPTPVLHCCGCKAMVTELFSMGDGRWRCVECYATNTPA